MVKVDDALIKKLENLSNIELNDEEKKIIRKDLEDILNYMQELDEIKTDESAEMFSPVFEDLRSVLHNDTPDFFSNVEKIINNFPEKNERLLKIPGIQN
ncbi:MAG: Asp-tRNA(Asn)/Glu-tRNA(Gln) amidotransferase subunit GatC [Thermotogae bacterium]|nr:Asp-tRNA(Asn)/Glu-tRNA(Gln) amidotransferase subunit GatC [Thermotogota bacterium]MCP5465966.1 Asp-tRNA(Asn)/Glu-tRNA(Gln) amidotransferase subunit GatC [Thermotogota bacterium]HOO74618.1 Asp-tRNA(Asn)/Glu-tRNA(Gln) amidotransferase subunit GatC [Tepiditoga sp.]